VRVDDQVGGGVCHIVSAYAKESRLLDLEADGTLPQAKIKAKLRQIQANRQEIEAGLSTTAAEPAVVSRSL